ncbi:MAG: nucleotidyltransferase family protein [Candidatus Hodarchaeales archaeon]|jgi:UTP-glucose-1-phosphate uridylyltransferase
MIGIALIPAAGKGTRMLPNTRSYPKELMEFGEKPIIEHVISTVQQAGVRRIILIVGHKKGAIIDYIGDGKHFGLEANFIFQEEALGLGHAIFSGHTLIEHQYMDFLVCFGDNIIQPAREISNLITLHEEHKPLATIMTFTTQTPEKYGVVQVVRAEDKTLKVANIMEKPQTAEQQRPFLHEGTYHAVSSVLAFNTKIFDYLRKVKPGHGGEIQITDAIGLGIKAGEKVLVYPLQGRFIDIGGWEYLREQRKYFCEMSEEKLEEIIEERKKLMQRLRDS